MRTRDDLEAAFALIEQDMDAYDTVDDAAAIATIRERAADPEVRVRAADPEVRERAAEPDFVVTSAARLPRADRPHRFDRTARSWRLPVGASVAAAVAVAGVALAGSDGGGGATPPGGGAPAQRVADTLPFTLAAHSGLAVTSVSSGPDARTVGLVGRSDRFEVSFGTATGAQPTPGLTRVTINGRPGFYDDGSLPPLTDTASATAPADASAPNATPSYAPGAARIRAVVWEYAKGSWALLTPDGTTPDEAALLHAARSLTPAKAAPLAVSFRLTRAPEGGSLAWVEATGRIIGTSTPPFTPTRHATIAEAEYAMPGTANLVSITVESVVLLGQGDQSATVGTGVRVDGHNARWDPAGHQLIVDLGGGVHVRVAESLFGDRYTLSLADLERVFGLVRPVPTVSDPAQWVPATTALP